MKRRIYTSKGFGILEVLLAGVIIITMLGALVVLGKTVLNNLDYSAQRTQATFLAQQGIEIVRQIRDTNYIDDNSETQWNTLVLRNGGTTVKSPDFGTDGNSAVFVSSYASNKNILIPNPPSEISLVSNNASNVFKRNFKFKKVSSNFKIGVNSVDENNAMIVTCEVTWGNDKSVTIEEMITNSHPNF